jgi:hypothetical protein
MKDTLIPAALVLGALLACKRPGPQPQSPQQSSTPAAVDAGADATPTDAAAPDDAAADGATTAEAVAGPKLTFECDGDERGCYDRARSECGGNFIEVEKTQSQSQISKPPPRAGKPALEILKPKITPHNAPPPMVHTKLTVSCVTADAGAPPPSLAPSAAPPSLAPAPAPGVDAGR